MFSDFCNKGVRQLLPPFKYPDFLRWHILLHVVLFPPVVLFPAAVAFALQE